MSDSPTRAKNSRLQIQGCSSRREAPLPSPEPACLVHPRRPVKRPAPGVPAWTAGPGVLDPWILQGRAAQPCGVPAEPPLHLKVRPGGGSALGLPGRPTVAPAPLSIDHNSCFILMFHFSGRRRGRKAMARRAASHDPDGIFRGTRRSGGPEGNLRTSGDSSRVPPDSKTGIQPAAAAAPPPPRLPRRAQPACRPGRASDPGGPGAAACPQSPAGPKRPPALHAPLGAWAAASWAVGARPGRGLPAALPGTRAGL